MVAIATAETISPRTEVVEHCPICGSEETSFFFSAPDRLHGISGQFDYHVCECRTVFQNPMVIPEDLSLCYPDDYYTHTPEQQNSDDVKQDDPVPESRVGLRGDLRRSVVDAVKGHL